MGMDWNPATLLNIIAGNWMHIPETYNVVSKKYELCVLIRFSLHTNINCVLSCKRPRMSGALLQCMLEVKATHHTTGASKILDDFMAGFMADICVHLYIYIYIYTSYHILFIYIYIYMSFTWFALISYIYNILQWAVYHIWYK